MTIRQLFDPSRDISRAIEKVISFGISEEERLKKEISEYIVTDNIDSHFEELLLKMEAAMEQGGENEVGVWVSGFYGSGKSSFTKYLGMAFDNKITIGGIPFIDHLQDRLRKPQTKSLLKSVVQRFPAAVVMLDLATDQLSGATMEEITTVLFHKVLQWAGYSRNRKIAAFERRLKKENRYDELAALFKEKSGVEWEEYKNDESVVEALIPEIAHELYPNFYRTSESFNTDESDVVIFESDRVKEMLEIAREESGKEYIIFVIDEVGQYVASRQNLILNLDGLAKNLKAIGDGKVWIVATAQQTLTEDNAKAALNSAELYKLHDRFPIQIDLESNDIKEICYTRLLGKSPQGEKTLGQLFDHYGQKLRQNTRLVDARVYESELERQSFIDLYPFLPAHFDILLHLLGALAKSTGGVGLRSAIKIVQDILVSEQEGHPCLADQNTGVLVNTVTLYDALDKEIRRADPNIHKSVEQATKIRFTESKHSVHRDVAKTVGVLQILGNLPITRQNVVSLMHKNVEDGTQFDVINAAIDDLITDAFVALNEQDGVLKYFSDKLNEIGQERNQISVRAADSRKVVNEALTQVYSPLPAVQLHSTYTVTTGLKALASNGIPTSLSGERNPIQTLVELVEPQEIDNARTRLVDESRERSSRFNIYMVARKNTDIDALVLEICRSREMADRYRNDPDQEVREYCRAQTDWATTKFTQLLTQIKRSLTLGSFIFRGQAEAVDTIDNELLSAAKKHLGIVANQVFDRYTEAPHRVRTDAAEKFLRAERLSGITSAMDPLGLVERNQGTHNINVQHKGLQSIRDYLDQNGSMDGKRLSDHFKEPPFGWSEDTLRYMVAAMLMAGEIVLKIGAREVTAAGQQAIDALKSNQAFKNVMVSLRGGERPSMDMLVKSSQRLTSLTGDTTLPMEDDISKATVKHFQKLQHSYGPVKEKLSQLKLPGRTKLENLTNEIQDVLSSDASDAAKRLGADNSELYEALTWAAELKKQFDQGLESTLNELAQHASAIVALPNIDALQKLKQASSEIMETVESYRQLEEFFKHQADFNSALTSIRSEITRTATTREKQFAQTIKQAVAELTYVAEWGELTNQERQQLINGLEESELQVSKDLNGLQALVSADYELKQRLEKCKNEITRLGQERIANTYKVNSDAGENKGTEPNNTPVKPTTITRQIRTKGTITNKQELDRIIRELQLLRNSLNEQMDFVLSLELETD